jgi:hypothetical protein
MGLKDRGLVFQFPEGVRNLSLLQNVQTASGAHLTFYSMGTGCQVTGA